MSVLVALLAIVASGLGAVTRYGLNQLEPNTRWPWPTVVANLIGSGVLGAVAAAVIVGGVPVGWHLVLGGGFAGGLSTVSTLAVDALLLWRDGDRRGCATYVVITLAVGFIAAAVGWLITAGAMD